MSRVKRMRPIMTFKYPVKVEVYRPDFELFASVRYLDIAKLAKAASAQIEIGYLKNACGMQMVRAAIKNGRVTGLKIDLCSEGKERLPAELVRILDVARRKVSRPDKNPPRFPIPVAAFARRAADISTDTIVLSCVSICIYGSCILYCKDETGQWYCSTKGIIIRPPKQ